ncbi:hypothetical protein H4219_002859 [Mycoemilia scoparia]|uniref:Uncharacterized protein n=1 Tax=Mycoemilia scoparia TaxID=417184 RepID=A0A9W8A264_9FUNG|nr:hypothetical protein H4219_002859 [Mycoemilia scoparia]
MSSQYTEISPHPARAVNYLVHQVDQNAVTIDNSTSGGSGVAGSYPSDIPLTHQDLLPPVNSSISPNITANPDPDNHNCNVNTDDHNYSNYNIHPIYITPAECDEFSEYSKMFDIEITRDNLYRKPMELLEELERLKRQLNELNFNVVPTYSVISLTKMMLSVCNKLSAWERFIRLYSFKNIDRPIDRTALMNFVLKFMNIRITTTSNILTFFHGIPHDSLCSDVMDPAYNDFISWVLIPGRKLYTFYTPVPNTFSSEYHYHTGHNPQYRANSITSRLHKFYRHAHLKSFQQNAQSKLVSLPNYPRQQRFSMAEVELMFGNDLYSLSNILVEYFTQCHIMDLDKERFGQQIKNVVYGLKPIFSKCVRAMEKDLSDPNIPVYKFRRSSLSQRNNKVNIGDLVYYISYNSDLNYALSKYHDIHCDYLYKSSLIKKSEDLLGINLVYEEICKYAEKGYFHNFRIDDKNQQTILGRVVADERNGNNFHESAEVIRGTYPKNSEGSGGVVIPGTTLFAYNTISAEYLDTHPDVFRNVENSYRLAGQAIALAMSERVSSNLEDMVINERLISHIFGELYAGVPYSKEHLANLSGNHNSQDGDDAGLDVEYIQRRLAIRKFLKYFFNGIMCITFTEIYCVFQQKGGRQLDITNCHENPLAILLKNLREYTGYIGLFDELNSDLVQFLKLFFVDGVCNDPYHGFFFEFFKRSFAVQIESKYNGLNSGAGGNTELQEHGSGIVRGDNNHVDTLNQHMKEMLDELQNQLLCLCKHSHKEFVGSIKNVLGGCEMNSYTIYDYFNKHI